MNDQGPRTVGELIVILQQFDPTDRIEFTSTDGPEYGWLAIGKDDPYHHPHTNITNDGVR